MTSKTATFPPALLIYANINGFSANRPKLQHFIEREKPDILLLQLVHTVCPGYVEHWSNNLGYDIHLNTQATHAKLEKYFFQGTTILIKQDWIKDHQLNITHRIIIPHRLNSISFDEGNTVILSIYAPPSGAGIKTQFYSDFRNRIGSLSGNTVVLG